MASDQGIATPIVGPKGPHENLHFFLGKKYALENFDSPSGPTLKTNAGAFTASTHVVSPT